jgi:hypothetical protein
MTHGSPSLVMGPMRARPHLSTDFTSCAVTNEGMYFARWLVGAVEVAAPRTRSHQSRCLCSMCRAFSTSNLRARRKRSNVSSSKQKLGSLHLASPNRRCISCSAAICSKLRWPLQPHVSLATCGLDGGGLDGGGCGDCAGCGGDCTVDADAGVDAAATTVEGRSDNWRLGGAIGRETGVERAAGGGRATALAVVKTMAGGAGSGVAADRDRNRHSSAERNSPKQLRRNSHDGNTSSAPA